MSKVVVYHHNCHDGITALWCALQSPKWKDAEHYPGRYDEPPDLEALKGRHVLVVDFSWKRGPLLELYAVAKSLRVLDHHKTAEAELEGLKFCTFDMKRSGAGLVWDELIGGTRPTLVDYVEDRDLWRFELPFCKEVHAACNSYPLDLAERELLMCRDIQSLKAEGVSILRYHDKLVQSAVKWARREDIGGHNVPSLNCPTIELVSDICHHLAKGEQFAATWIEKDDGSRTYQLRSAPDGIDVSEIAIAYGGGGHKHAAGFTVDPLKRVLQ